MNKFTKKQEDVLHYICKHIHSTGFSPSIREIGSALGLSSPATVKHYLEKLVEHGHITVEEGKTRSISLKGNWLKQYHVPVVEDWETQLLTFPENTKSLEPWVKDFLIYHDERAHGSHLGVKLTGDYLQERGILSGDMLILGRLEEEASPTQGLYLAEYEEKSYLGTVEGTTFQGAVGTTMPLADCHLIASLVGVQRHYD